MWKMSLNRWHPSQAGVMKKNHLCREKVRHIPDQGHSRCKGPEVNTSLAYCNWHVEGSYFSGALSPGSLLLQPITFPVALALLSLKQPNPSLDQSFSLAIPSTQNALLPLPKKVFASLTPYHLSFGSNVNPSEKEEFLLTLMKVATHHFYCLILILLPHLRLTHFPVYFVCCLSPAQEGRLLREDLVYLAHW